MNSVPFESWMEIDMRSEGDGTLEAVDAILQGADDLVIALAGDQGLHLHAPLFHARVDIARENGVGRDPELAHFLGQRALTQISKEGPRHRLVGFRITDGDVIPEEGLQIVEAGRDGRTSIIGWVTSSRYSPTLEEGIGLCWLPARLAEEEAAPAEPMEKLVLVGDHHPRAEANLPGACGLHGCLETISAGPSIARHWPQGDGTAEAVFAAAEQGDPAARQVIERAAEGVARAIQLLVMTYDVETVVLGGGVMNAGDAFLKPIHTVLAGMRDESSLAERMLPAGKVVAAPPDADVACWGAVLLALQAFNDPGLRLSGR